MLINQLRGTNTWSALDISSCTLRQLHDPNIFELFGQDLSSCCNLQWFSSASGAVFEEKMHDMYIYIIFFLESFNEPCMVFMDCCMLHWAAAMTPSYAMLGDDRQEYCEGTREDSGVKSGVCSKPPRNLPGPTATNYHRDSCHRENVYIWKDCRCSIHQSV